jgi:hypothetical protein
LSSLPKQTNQIPIREVNAIRLAFQRSTFFSKGVRLRRVLAATIGSDSCGQVKDRHGLRQTTTRRIDHK